MLLYGVSESVNSIKIYLIRKKMKAADMKAAAEAEKNGEKDESLPTAIEND